VKGEGSADCDPSGPAHARVRAPKGSTHQKKRQAALDAAREEKGKEAAASTAAGSPQLILKCPETAAAEKREAERAAKTAEKAAAKAEASKRWETGGLNEEEEEVYRRATRPISGLADDSADLEEMAAGNRIAHMVGIRASLPPPVSGQMTLTQNATQAEKQNSRIH